jgi:hypothetical protein
MHASYGLGAVIGPLLVTALLSGQLSWRWPNRVLSWAVAAVPLGAALMTVPGPGSLAIAALPAGIGLGTGAVNASVLAPAMLAFGLAMCGVYLLLSRFR